MQQNDSSCQDQREDRQPKINTEIAADLVKNLQNVDTDLFFELMSENYSAGWCSLPVARMTERRQSGLWTVILNFARDTRSYQELIRFLQK